MLKIEIEGIDDLIAFINIIVGFTLRNEMNEVSKSLDESTNELDNAIEQERKNESSS